jgi:hypothetical protein
MTPVDPEFVAPRRATSVGGDDSPPGRGTIRAYARCWRRNRSDGRTLRSAFAFRARARAARGRVNERWRSTPATPRVDLESRGGNMSPGDRYPIRNVDDAFLERFRPTDA